MDSGDIIRDAMEIAEEQWKAGRDEVAQDMPPCSEGMEDEVKALKIAIASLIQKNNENVPGVYFRALVVHRIVGADVSLWDVKGCVEGHCGRSSCTARHHLMARFLIAKRSDGVYVVLKEEEIVDRREENPACCARIMPLMIGLVEAVRNKTNGDDPLPPEAPLPDEESTLNLLRRAGQRMAQKTWQALQKAGLV